LSRRTGTGRRSVAHCGEIPDRARGEKNPAHESVSAPTGWLATRRGCAVYAIWDRGVNEIAPRNVLSTPAHEIHLAETQSKPEMGKMTAGLSPDGTSLRECKSFIIRLRLQSPHPKCPKPPRPLYPTLIVPRPTAQGW
jgi:hypothetical protein